ncbi:MAG: hypothetical protein ACR2LK_08795 [Solirubrobacteraceae bacterium]
MTDIVVRVEVTHRRMRTRCACGCRTLADLPVGVPAGAFGPAVAAAAATLTAARLSRRDSARLLGDLCGVTISTAATLPACKPTPPSSARACTLLIKGARSRDAKTKRFCAGLLAHEDALWTFTRVTDVPATNNAARTP